MTDTATNNKRIARNTIYLYFRMLLTMAVQLYASRVVLNVLGVEDYGIYNIVAGVVVLFSFINNSLVSATQRFLNFELGRGDADSTQRVFSMSLTIHICVAIIVALLAETVGLWFLNTQINIPIERVNAANWAYQFSILSVCTSFVQIPFYASVVACEKMEFFARIAIVEVALKLTIVFLLVWIDLDKLKLYSILSFSVSLIVLGCYRWFCSKRINFCRYQYFWDKSMFNKLLSFSGWMLLGSAAGVGSTQGVNILLNIFYGVAVNAAVGISNHVNAAVNQFVSNFQTAFTPQIVKLYAVGDIPQMRRLVNRSSRFSFFLLLMVACPIMLNLDFILELWLKNVPEHASTFCLLILAYSLVESMSKPVGMAIHATGRVKYYNIIMSTALSLNIVFSFVFLSCGYPPETVAVISIFICILCLVVRLLMAQHYGILRIYEYLGNVVMRIIPVVILVIPLPAYMSKHFSSWNSLIFTSMLFFLLYTLIVLSIGLTQAERNRIYSFIRAKLCAIKK